MIHCFKCGADLADNMFYCLHCGERLVGAVATVIGDRPTEHETLVLSTRAAIVGTPASEAVSATAKVGIAVIGLAAIAGLFYLLGRQRSATPGDASTVNAAGNSADGTAAAPTASPSQYATGPLPTITVPSVTRPTRTPIDIDKWQGNINREMEQRPRRPTPQIQPYQPPPFIPPANDYYRPVNRPPRPQMTPRMGPRPSPGNGN